MARFSKNSENIDSAVEAPSVRVAKSTYRKIVVKRFVKILSYVVLILLGFYVVFAATLLRVVPSNVGFVPVKNMTFEGGVAPSGAQLLISVNNPQGTHFTDRLKQAFLPTYDAAIVEVVAGPYGKLAWVEPDILTLDGYPTEVSLLPNSEGESPLVNRSEYLQDEYLALCIEGSCSVGDGIIFHKDKIIGSPLTRASVDTVLGKEE